MSSELVILILALAIPVFSGLFLLLGVRIARKIEAGQAVFDFNKIKEEEIDSGF